jgi:hypothetical protein
MLASLVALFTVSSDLAKLKPPPQRDVLRALIAERLHGPPPPPPPPDPNVVPGGFP